MPDKTHWQNIYFNHSKMNPEGKVDIYTMPDKTHWQNIYFNHSKMNPEGKTAVVVIAKRAHTHTHARTHPPIPTHTPVQSLEVGVGAWLSSFICSGQAFLNY